MKDVTRHYGDRARELVTAFTKTGKRGYGAEFEATIELLEREAGVTRI
jgi:hypothetical protein